MNYYVGLSLSSGSTLDTGLAVLDEDNNLILIDKFYKMNDIIHFFEKLLLRARIAGFLDGRRRLMFILCSHPFMDAWRPVCGENT